MDQDTMPEMSNQIDSANLNEQILKMKDGQNKKEDLAKMFENM
jgi:hypothetical protein